MNTPPLTPWGTRLRVEGAEINRDLIARIATLVAYDLTDDEIVARVGDTDTAPARWVRFMAGAIRRGTYTVTP